VVGFEVDGRDVVGRTVGRRVAGEELVGALLGLETVGASVGAEVKYFSRFKNAGLFDKSIY
jgi:hypothetical protein